ncbi:MAG: DUF2306 domain-containing protein [Pseudomonadota bacterium]
MSIEPLLAERGVVVLHAFFALLAIGVMGLLFTLPKGRRAHRVLGWIWVLSMAALALSSFGIQSLRQIGPFSWLHGLALFTLVSLYQNVAAARRHNAAAHRRGMIWLAVLGLGVTGAATLLPGRVMHAVVLGG